MQLDDDDIEEFRVVYRKGFPGSFRLAHGLAH